MAEAMLRAAPERFSVAGHSMDGRVALAAACRGLALLNTGYLPLPAIIDSRRIHDTALVEAITTMMPRKTPQIFAAQVRALLCRPDATAILDQIRCPTLVLTGRRNGWSTPTQHTAMAPLREPGFVRVKLLESGPHSEF
jgi:pimeloyl-ACP methyl ester carboxylesterase